MNHRELLLYSFTLTLELVLCVLVYARNLHRRFPFFALYVAEFSMYSVIVGLIYHFFGFRSITSYYAYWIGANVDLIARSLVVAELCRYGLREYRGIWTLTWRLLLMLGFFFVGNAVVDAWGQPNRLVISSLTFGRDINAASIIILVLLFLIRTYYHLALEPVHKLIAVGISLYSIVDIINSTFFRDQLTGYLYMWFSIDHTSLWPVLMPQVERVKDLWGLVHVSIFMISMSIWCFALRKPLPAPAPSPVLLPIEVYREMSHASNLGLRAFNDRLLEMLKP